MVAPKSDDQREHGVCRAARFSGGLTYGIMGTENKIPPEIARELRGLAHDLSNSLETILQATYLVSQAELPENARRWMEMMDQASQEAIATNRKLREILRSQS